MKLPANDRWARVLAAMDLVIVDDRVVAAGLISRAIALLADATGWDAPDVCWRNHTEAG